MTVSLFAGIGGIDLGLERAGMRCLWQVRSMMEQCETLKQHWPSVLRRRDVYDCGDNLPGLMLLVADLCAPTSATPDPEPDLRESAAVVPGANMPVSFANYDPLPHPRGERGELCLDGNGRGSRTLSALRYDAEWSVLTVTPGCATYTGACSWWSTPTKSPSGGEARKPSVP